jgi:beta-barrel assembly-enhancing protease
MTEAQPAFDGYISHPSIGDVAGKIVFVGWRLRFESAAVVREILLVKLQMNRDPEMPGGIVFCDPDHAEWVIHTPDEGILHHESLRQQPHTRHQIQALHGGRDLKRALKITGTFLGGFALAALVVSLLTSLMVRSLVARIPVEWEQEFGDDIMAELKQDETFVDDARMRTNLLQAVAPLMRAVPTNGIEYRFYLQQDPEPNAFALPGGYVIVTTSLLELADRPEEIAGAVAHEVAHVTLKHGFRKIISSAGPYLLCQLFLRSDRGLLGVLAGGSQLLVHQSFSQEYELEADDAAWQYLVAARIDPRGLPDMLKKLEADTQRRKLKLTAPQALSSHPATDKRLRRLEAKWRTLKAKSGFQAYDNIKP